MLPEYLINILAFLSCYFAMEGVAWFTHKYIMHGPLWNLHKSHHSEKHGVFEKNDFFFLIYALIAMVLMYFGWDGLDYRFWMGLGVTAYGFTYFLLHDIFIHNRLKLFRKTKSVYFEAMRRAHKMHHKHLGKENGEEFGLLLFNPKYIRQFRKELNK